MLAHESGSMSAHRRHDGLRMRILLDPCSDAEAAITTSGQSWFRHVRRLDLDASDLRHVLVSNIVSVSFGA
ncbi:hypothetical protein DPMN_066839 [Dreissena polymorpha]|uniref:Uncharacterized protein n=1 Tax=Dreissena polymorpha TaxID=45954 RepID=A0A9D4BVC6_DREPO|nr:hypothetical protein DPMN_066839 [Dreissena polymorpha]